jgi:hypothetical protein
MLSHVGGLGSVEAAERAEELAPLAAGDTLTLVTDWVFWSAMPEDDRPAFENFQRYTVFDSW